MRAGSAWAWHDRGAVTACADFGAVVEKCCGGAGPMLPYLLVYDSVSAAAPAKARANGRGGRVRGR